MFLDVKGTAAYTIKRKSATDRMLRRGHRHSFIADRRGSRPTATSAEGVSFVVALAKGRCALRCCRNFSIQAKLRSAACDILIVAQSTEG